MGFRRTFDTYWLLTLESGEKGNGITGKLKNSFTFEKSPFLLMVLVVLPLNYNPFKVGSKLKVGGGGKPTKKFL